MEQVRNEQTIYSAANNTNNAKLPKGAKLHNENQKSIFLNSTVCYASCTYEFYYCIVRHCSVRADRASHLGYYSEDNHIRIVTVCVSICVHKTQ